MNVMLYGWPTWQLLVTTLLVRRREADAGGQLIPWAVKGHSWVPAMYAPVRVVASTIKMSLALGDSFHVSKRNSGRVVVWRYQR